MRKCLLFCSFESLSKDEDMLLLSLQSRTQMWRRMPGAGALSVFVKDTVNNAKTVSDILSAELILIYVTQGERKQIIYWTVREGPWGADEFYIFRDVLEMYNVTHL